jgi:multisubunit Na+/H+ antiporter MnhB subunit
MRSPVALAADVLLPPILVAALAWLVKGAGHTGGGFAAGVVAALGFVLQRLSPGRSEAAQRAAGSTWHRLAVAGLGLMAATLLWPVLAGRPPAWHLPRPGDSLASLGALDLATPLLFEIGVGLATLGFLVATVHELAPVEEADRES